MGAIAHLYRGEIYRSTIWRTRLDTTTNWAVVTLGIALSITFATPNASPLPLLLVGILIFFFMMLEARRYRYFNVWRARARWLENNFYAPILRKQGVTAGDEWCQTLARDYLQPDYHISMHRAVGRRIRRNYVWILLIQALAYVGKLGVHPTPVSSWATFVDRSSIGPVPGLLILSAGAVYVGVFAGFAIWSRQADAAKFHSRGPSPTSMG